MVAGRLEHTLNSPHMQAPNRSESVAGVMGSTERGVPYNRCKNIYTQELQHQVLWVTHFRHTYINTCYILEPM